MSPSLKVLSAIVVPVMVATAVPAESVTAQDAAARSDIARLGLKNYPSKEMLLARFAGLRVAVRREQAVFVLCGAKVLEGLSSAARRGLYPADLPFADSVVVEPECGPLPQVPIRGRSIVRVEEIAIGLDSSFVLARSLVGWDGVGPTPFREWLHEKLVWQHAHLPGSDFFTVWGWNRARDNSGGSPR